ncbi:MAG: DUF4123 domain-containing protein [Gammaproteobacteria bacterium]|nr:DUF4123 domain-containing protein [Gammaproteobacteria bacterium]
MHDSHLPGDMPLQQAAAHRLTPGTRAMIEAIQALGAQGGGRLYRLVDPDGSPGRGLGDSARRDCGQIKHPFVAQKPEQRLYLQSVGLAGQALTDRLAAELEAEVSQEIERTPDSHLDPVPFCAWVYSRASLPHIVNHLYQQRVIRSTGPKPALFRYQDPRVFERLLEILLPQQLNHLLGPIDAWWFLDHQRQLQGVQMPPLSTPLPRTSLAPHQWQAVKRIGQVNACLEGWRRLKRADKRHVTPAEMDELLVKAEAHGLKDAKDQRLFVTHGLLTPGFYRHPAIQRLLPSGGETEPFTLAIRRISDPDWDSIKHDLEHRLT